jgi:hypothetical protein
MALTFHYKEVLSHSGKKIKRPLVPVTFSNGDESFDTIGLIDSGADVTAINQEMAEVLGLDLSGPIEKSYGIGGSIDTVRSKVKIIIANKHEKYSMTIPIIVLLIDDKKIPPILGRKGFFDEFIVTLDDNREKIQLKKIQTFNRKTRPRLKP